jgi:hypothetical protein
MVVPGIQDKLNKRELLLLLQKWSVWWMFSSSPPTHLKIGCANHLNIWEQDSTWAEMEVALPLEAPLWEKRGFCAGGICARWA